MKYIFIIFFSFYGLFFNNGLKAAEKIKIKFEEMEIPLTIEQLSKLEKYKDDSTELIDWLKKNGFIRVFELSKFLEFPVFKEEGLNREILRSWIGRKILTELSKSIKVPNDNNGTEIYNTIENLLDQKKDITEFNVEIKKDGKYAFFTEHMPFEFEADEHFFKDLAKNDIEPVAQEPDMGGHSEHGAEGFEWAGTFDLEEGSYKWSFAKVDGEYADPAMKMVILKSGDIEESEVLAKELLESEDSIYKADNDVLLASSKAISLNFDQGKESTVFNVEIKKSGKYTFFTEHMPFEFEADEHFFKDVSNNDVEPIAQVPDEGDGHHHHHHGHGSLDPHVWHDPANIIKMSKVISKNLKKDISIFNRKDRKSINERIDSTESLLSGLNGWIVDQVSTIPEQDRVLVSKHKAMDYYGAAFGFETVSLLDFLGDSSSLRPENISSTLNMLKEDNVKAIFPEQIPASKLLKNLSRQSSVPLASNQIFVDGLMMKGNTISVAVHNTCTIVDSLGGSCDKESGSNLESEWFKLSD
ncbi:zinc ABC transporter substrate-binding protein [Prochlorococcus sp. AH-716-I07]|nr:zinc ABC transporter substrate-binding protein [Prochlorococcus sp. AH-716-I07]